MVSALIMGHLSFLGERELHPSDSAFFSSFSLIPRPLIRKGRLQEDLHVVFCHGEGAHSCKQAYWSSLRGEKGLSECEWIKKMYIYTMES